MVKKYYPPFLVNGIVVLTTLVFVAYFCAQGDGLGAIMSAFYGVLVGFVLNIWLGLFHFSLGKRALGTLYLVMAAVVLVIFFSIKPPYGT